VTYESLRRRVKAMVKLYWPRTGPTPSDEAVSFVTAIATAIAHLERERLRHELKEKSEASKDDADQ
jgi:hypothetical protein